MMIDKAAEPDAEHRRQHEIDARDHPRREHRLGFEKRPEGQREPHREIGDVGDQIIGEEMMEGLHGPRNLAPWPKRKRAGRIAAPALSVFAIRSLSEQLGHRRASALLFRSEEHTSELQSLMRIS